MLVRYSGPAANGRRLIAKDHLSAARLIPQLHVVSARVSQQTVETLRSDAAVVDVQDDPVVHISGDPLDWIIPWTAQQLDLADAWQVTSGSRQVVIAVLDTGVNANTDLQGVLLPGTDFIDNDSDPSDPNGHGTAVASAIAAIGGNNWGVTGTCQCSILPVRVVRADGSGTDATIAQGIIWAVDHGANIINLSLGGDAQDQALADAVNYALGKGVIVVAAAGNESSYNPFYPAADPGVISVAATDQTGQLASYSNHGSWVTLAAPGCGEAQIAGPDPSLTYFTTECGTSFAAPQVAALAGLALSTQPTPSSASVITALEQSAQPGLDVKYGAANAFSMLKALGAVPAPTVVSTPQLQGSIAVGHKISAFAGSFKTTGSAKTVLTIERCTKDLSVCRTVSSTGSYIISAADAGYRFRCTSTVTDLGGTVTAASAASAVLTVPVQASAAPARTKLGITPKAKPKKQVKHAQASRRVKPAHGRGS